MSDLACRLCGALWPAEDHLWINEGAGCPTCGGSPLCDACGHSRSDHARVYVQGGRHECRRRIGDFQTLTSAPCACAGYEPIAGALGEATFAQPDPPRDSDEPLPALRTAPR